MQEIRTRNRGDKPMNEKTDKNIKGDKGRPVSLQSNGKQNLQSLVGLGEILTMKRAYTFGIVLGISVGALFCICGLIIIILGFTGRIEWVMEVDGLTSKLTNAGPGGFFALLGMLILWRYRPMPYEALKIVVKGMRTEFAYTYRNPSRISLPLLSLRDIIDIVVETIGWFFSKLKKGNKDNHGSHR